MKSDLPRMEKPALTSAQRTDSQGTRNVEPLGMDLSHRPGGRFSLRPEIAPVTPKDALDKGPAPEHCTDIKILGSLRKDS